MQMTTIDMTKKMISSCHACCVVVEEIMSYCAGGVVGVVCGLKGEGVLLLNMLLIILKWGRGYILKQDHYREERARQLLVWYLV